MYDLKELDTQILYFTNCLENPKKLVQEIEASNSDIDIDRENVLTKWTPWYASNSPEDIYGENMHSRFTAIENEIPERPKYIITQIKNAFFNCAEKYKEFYNLPYDVLIDKEFGIKKYFVGQRLGDHADQYDGNYRLRYSMVLYLNDDYEGGELRFKNHDITIKTEAGSLVIFPSSEPFLHASDILISGNKIMCPAFWMNNEKGSL
jgi:hypothetical protein